MNSLPIDLKAYSGAKGDGVTDDYQVLQSSINTLISQGILSFKLSAGNYLISKGLVFQDPNGFLVGASLTGDGSAYDKTPSQTVITCLTGNDFAINLQRVKGFRLSNILVIGKNTDIGNYSVPQILQDPTITFVTPGVSNAQTFPHCGIGVDLFATGATLANQYPGFAADYALQTSSGGSTDIVIDSCRAQFFVVGICICPHGNPQNGEIISINNCWSDNNKVALSTGQSQNRTVLVNNFHCWIAETIFDTNYYGDGTGCPPTVTGLNAAGAIRYLCSLNTWVSQGLPIRDSHMESIWSLGGSSDPTGGTLTIEDSWVGFVGSLPANIYGVSVEQPRTVFNGGNLKVTNSHLWQYGTGYALPFNITCPNAVFNNVFFDYIPIVNGNASYENCQTNISRFGHHMVIGTGGQPSSLQNYKGLFLGDMSCFYAGGRMRRRVNNVQNGYNGIVLVNFAAVFIAIDNDPVNLRTTIKLAFSSTDYKNIIIGDMLYYYTPDEYGKNIVTPLGMVFSKDDTTGNVVVSGRNIPIGTYAGGIIRNEFYIPVLILGNTTAGSNVMTKVHQESNANYALVGIPIYIPQFPFGTTISSYDPIHNTLTLSQPAIYNDYEVVVSSAAWKGEEIGTPDTKNTEVWGYKRGDIIWNNRLDKYSSITYWTCIKSGLTGTNNPPTFVSY